MAEQGTQQTTYQMAALTSGLAEKLIQDDSPQTLLDELWQFLNAPIMTANLTYVDFLNIMDFVDIAFANMLTGIPEDEWGSYMIKETLWDKDPDTGEMVAVKTKEYPITELWDATRTKVYIKCCNSRDGHLIRMLTEQRSSIRQAYSEYGTNRPDMAPIAPGTPAPDNSGWRAM